MADGSIVIDTKIDSTGLDKQLSNLKSSLSNTTDSLNSLTTKALVGFAAIGAAVTPAIKLASDLNESANAANVVFGASSKAIADWGKNAQKQAGLTSAQFNQMAAQIGASLINAGQSQDKAAEQTINLTKRAADMASIFNTDVSEALTAIQAGLRGESEPLRKFAVGLDEASVNAKAVEMGLAKSVSTVDNYAKSQARLAIIMDQSSKFQGDFVNTSDQLANSTRILTAQIQEQAAQAGAKLLPIVLKVIKGIMDWAEEGDRLKNAMQGVADAIKWATESGVAQGILAAAAALGVATLAMNAFVAASAITPGSAIIVGLSLLVGGLVAVGTQLDKNIKQQEEYERVIARTSKLSAEAQNVVLEAQARKLKTEIEEANSRWAGAANDKKIQGMALKNLEKLQEEYRAINRQIEQNKKVAEGAAAVTKNQTGGVTGSGTGKKELTEAEKAMQAMVKETDLLQQKWADGAISLQDWTDGYKSAAQTAIDALYAAGVTVDGSPMGKYLADLIARVHTLKQESADLMPDTNAKKAASALNEYQNGVDLLTQKMADGAISMEEFDSAMLKSAQSTIDQLYELGYKVDDSEIGQQLKSLIDMVSALKSAKINIDIPQPKVFSKEWLQKIGKNLVKDLPNIVKKGLQVAANVAKKSVAIIGQVITQGFAIIEKIAGGVGSIIQGLAEFDPQDLYDNLEDLLDGLNDFFENDIGASSAVAKAGAELIVTFLDGIKTKLPSILTTMSGALKSIIDTIKAYGPQIAATALTLVSSMIVTISGQLPSLISAGFGLISALNQGLEANLPTVMSSIFSAITGILDVIVTRLPEILQQGSSIVITLVQGIAAQAQAWGSKIGELVSSVITVIANNTTVLLAAGTDVVVNLVNGIASKAGSITDSIASLISSLLQSISDNLPKLIMSGINLVVSLVTGILQSLPKIAGAAVVMITNLVTNLLTEFTTQSPTIIAGIITMLVDGFVKDPLLLNLGFDIAWGIISGLGNAFVKLAGNLRSGLQTFINQVKAFFDNPAASFQKFGEYLVSGFIQGFTNKMLTAYNAVKGGLESFVSAVKNLFGIASPSKLFATFGGYLGEGLTDGFNNTDLFGNVEGSLNEFSSSVAGSKAMQSVLNGISSSANLALSVASQAALSSSGNAVANLTIPLTVDGKEIAKVSYQYVDKLNRVAYGA